MTLGEIITAVQRQFGDTAGVQIFESDVIRWANHAAIDIARETGCIQDHKEASSVGLDGSYTLPDDFLQMRRVTYDGRTLRPTTLETADNVWPDREVSNDSGTPQSYYIWSNILYLYPAPQSSGAGNLDIYYIRTPAVMDDPTDTSEIPLQYHEQIIRYCLSRAKELDEEPQEASLILQEYKGSVAQSRHDSQDQQKDSYPSVRLCPGDE